MLCAMRFALSGVKFVDKKVINKPNKSSAENDQPSLIRNAQETWQRMRKRFGVLFKRPESERDRSRKISRNFFLHIHSARIHKYSLKPTYTWGLGLIAFYLFIIEIVTGILLMIYYTPSVERAYASIQDITYVVMAGGFVRNMHRWAAHGMVLVVILHMARVFYTGSYGRGRSFNWLMGVFLLLATLLLSFSGYLLPWDQLAFWAVTIGTNIAASASELTAALGLKSVPDPGRFIKTVLLGGQAVGQDALIRFYLLHIVFLPLVTAILIGIHFWRIRKDGGLIRPADANLIISREEGSRDDNIRKKLALPAGEQESLQTILSWPSALWAEAAAFMLTLAILALASLFLNAPLNDMANPALPENPAKSPWYFVGLQELVSYSAFSGGIGIPVLVILSLISIPYLDREEFQNGEWFAGVTGKRITIKSLLYALLMTTGIVAFAIRWGWIRQWISAIPQIIVIFINPGTLLALIYAFWSLYVFKKTGSTRLSALALFTCIVVGFVFLTVLGMWFRGPNWEFYWWPTLWPGH
jgi:quinol-cytochrome oxidoreductase complex cytochrome b subunit